MANSLKLKFIFRRWLDLVAYVAISVLLVSLAINPLHRLILKVVEPLLAAWSVVTVILFLFLASVAVALGATRMRLIALRGPFHLLAYPPLWVAGFLGCGVLWALWVWGAFGSPPPRQDACFFGGFVVAAVTLATALDAGYRWISPSPSPLATPSSPAASGSGKWWDNDNPITDEKGDRYGAKRAADRLADHLRQGRSVALTGAFGSGKTSIQILARQQLDPQKYWYVTVPGWGLADKNAPSHILNLVVREIARHVDPTRLIAVPRHYRDALGSAYATAGAILHALAGPRDPYQVLAEVDEVLAALDVTLIVALEDLDRNASRDDADTAMRHANALLDRLHSLPHLTFVLAVDLRHSGAVDLVRLFDHIEILAPLTRSVVQKELAGFLASELALHEGQINSTGSSFLELQQKWLGVYSDPRSRDQEDNLKIVAGLRPPDRAAQAVVRLLNTPRNLKAVFRQTAHAWETLRGEVNPIDLLVATTLKVAAPEAWEFMAGEIDEMRGIGNNISFAVGGSQAEEWAAEQRDPLSARLTQHCKGALWNRDDIDVLIQHLLGVWLPTSGEVTSGVPNEHLQRAASEEEAPVDYLRRIIRGAVDESPTDQEFLQALQTWIEEQKTHLVSEEVSGGDGKFIEMLHDQPHAASLLEYFASMLPADLTLPLAEQLIARSLEKFGNAAYFDSSDAHVAIWRIANRRKGKIGSVSRFLRRQLRACVPVSLELAHDLKYYWSSEHTVIRHDQFRKCAGRRLNRLCRKFLSDADRWLGTLPPQRPAEGDSQPSSQRHAHNIYLLHHLMRWHEDNIPPETWSWSVDPLLAAGEREPDRVVPMLRALLSRDEGMRFSQEDGRPTTRNYFFDEDFLRDWCPNTESQRRLLEMLAGSVRTTDNAGQNALNHAVRDGAAAFLRNLPSQADRSLGQKDKEGL